MPNNVLTQLKALRDGVAEELRKDPRYQTLQSLDKSIAEITTVLSSAGLLPPTGQASSLSARLSGLGPATDVLTEPSNAAPQASKQAAIAAPPAEPAASAAAPAGPTPGFKDGTVSAPQAAVPKKKGISSLLKPAAGIAAVLVAAGGVAAEAMHLRDQANTAKNSKDAAQDATDDAEEDEGVEPTHEGEHPTDVAEADEDKTEDEADVAEAAEDESDDHPEPVHAHGHEAPRHEPAGKAEAEAVEESEDIEESEDAAVKAEEAEDAGAEMEDAPPAPAKHGRAPGKVEHDEADEGEDAKAEASGDADDAPADGKALPPKKSGYVPMAAKAGAAQYTPSIAVKFGKLPNKVDLRPLMTPIEDQGQTSSCVANAVAGAYEYWIKKASKQDQNISRLFVYYNARWRDGSQDKDEGSVIQLAMEGLQKFGACDEKAWPFDPRLILKKPGAEAYKEGAPFRVHDMAQVPLKLDAWKQALAEGKPIVFGIELFDSFDECTKRGGVVPMPAPDDLARKKHSGHSMCAVGYSDSEKVFIVRNSWGTAFGDKGYCYMPYDYLLNPKFNDADCWVFVPKVPSQPPRETWQDDTKPVTNDGRGVDFEIMPYEVHDYAHIVVDLFQHSRRPWNEHILTDYGHYVSAVSRSVFTELESFDVMTFLSTTALLAGVGITAAAMSESFSSEMTATETVTAETLEESEEDSEEDADDAAEDEADESADDDADEDADDADADAEDSDDAEEDAEEDADDAEADDDAEDPDADGEEDADDAEADGEGAEAEDDAEADDEDAGEDAEAEDGDAEDDAEGEDEADGEDDAEGDEEAEGEDDAEDDAGEDDAGEDDSGGDDDGGGDDSGGDDE